MQDLTIVRIDVSTCAALTAHVSHSQMQTIAVSAEAKSIPAEPLDSQVDAELKLTLVSRDSTPDPGLSLSSALFGPRPSLPLGLASTTITSVFTPLTRHCRHSRHCCHHAAPLSAGTAPVNATDTSFSTSTLAASPLVAATLNSARSSASPSLPSLPPLPFPPTPPLT